MVLGMGQSKGGQAKEDIPALLAKKQYAKAIEAIKAQLKSGRPDDRLRLQLADVLVLAKKEKEAVMILLPLADDYAKEGFAAKAISVLKKVQKIDPGRRDVGAKLAALIQEKQRVATVSVPSPSSGMLELGMEEIGFEPPSRGPVAVPAAEEAAAHQPRSPFAAEPEPSAPPPPEARAPVVDRDLFVEEAEEVEAAPLIEPAQEPEPELSFEPVVEAEPEFSLEPEPEPEPSLEPEISVEPEISAEPEPVAETSDPMSEALFGEELLALVDGAFGNLGSFEEERPTSPQEDVEGRAAGGSQIVVSPLFKDFSVDELVAVIQGLNLLTFEAGDIIITEGDPGDSLYMLTTGTVKAMKKNAAGRQASLGQLTEGAFFGEVSILTGQPRTATIVALTRCELLELDRPTLDSITKTHPHVREILQEFADQRLKRKA